MFICALSQQTNAVYHHLECPKIVSMYYLFTQIALQRLIALLVQKTNYCMQCNRWQT